MGVAYYIEVEDETLEVATEVDGKAAARAIEQLGALSQELGLPELDAFLGQSFDEISDLLGEDIAPEEGVDPAAKWFAPEEGIRVLAGLLQALAKNPKRVMNGKAVVEDLQDYLSVLEKAKAAGSRWHLAMDI